MKKALLSVALAATCCAGLTMSAGAQTYLLPDNHIRDPRMAVIRAKLQSDHGSIRPLTTYTDMDIRRRWNEEGFFFSTLEELLLEAGAEPVRSKQAAQFELYLASHGILDPESGLIVETLSLRLTDRRAGGGGQLIMSSTSTLQCRNTSRAFIPPLICPISRDILLESFLRLR